MADFLSNLSFGKPNQVQQVPRFSQQQSNLINQQVIPSLGPMLQQLQQQQGQGFAPYAQKAREDFAHKTVPLLSERFAGLGQQGSPHAKYALSSAGADLETNLKGLESQYDFQNRGQQQQLLQSLLALSSEPQFENIFQPAQEGFFDYAASGLGSALGSAVGSASPSIGGAIGTGAGWLISRLISYLSGGTLQ